MQITDPIADLLTRIRNASIKSLSAGSDFKGAYPEEDFQRMFQKRKRQGLIHRNISK